MATTNITLTITTPTGVTVAEAIDAFARAYSYKATLADGSNNPETKTAFCKRMIAEKVQQVIQRQFMIDAEDAARAAELAKAQVTVE